MRLTQWFRDLVRSSLQDPISLFGAVILSISAAIILTILLLDFLGFHQNPYVGVLVFMILPAAFVLGLVLIPVGVIHERRRARGRSQAYPIINLNLSTHRNRFLAVTVVTFFNVVILATVTYKGVEYMDSVQFCGQTCHSVMQPEYAAYLRSPHSRVACVDCHIGPGAGWFVKSKLSGVGQVFAVTFNTFQRPIPTPIENLRPARETCEQCHWPEKFHGDRIKVKTKYAEDEANTELKTALILKVGGGSRESGFAGGIHWHMNIANKVTYVPADETRMEIPFIRFKDETGRVTEYLVDGAAKPTEEEIRERGRVMDCMDCHNRPSHIYYEPEQEVDNAILAGKIDRSLPFVRKQGVEILRREYDSRSQAREAIPVLLEEYYEREYPDVARERSAAIRQAGQELAEIHALNVYPELNITWGTYPNHIGHMTAPGCSRCHDGLHSSEDGRTIREDCETCHTLLAMEEENPEILTTLFPE
jgi:hypothetical protein